MTMGHLIGKYSMIPLYVLCIALCYPVSAQTEQGIQNVTAEGAFGKEAVIKCILRPHNLTAKWLFQGADVKFGDRITQNKTEIPSGITDNDGTKVINLVATLRIANTSDADVGNYTCVAGGQSRSVILNLSYPGKLVESTKGPLRFNITEGAKPVLNLSCTFEVYNQTKAEWILHREALEDKQLEATSTRDKNNARLLKSYYTTPIVLSAFDDQNGTYICQAWDPDTLKYITGKTDVLIYALPVLDITNAIAISSSQIFFNWTVKNYNSPIKRYYLSILSEHDTAGHKLIVDHKIDPKSTKYVLEELKKNTTYDIAGYKLIVNHKIDPKSTKYVLEELKKNTTYDIKLSVNTEFGDSKSQQFPTPKHQVRTLLKDPVFVPNISINGFSSKSMTIGLSPPPPDVAEYVHYYMLERWKKGHNETLKAADHYRDDRNLPYMFNDLDPHSTYVFRARACSDYTKKCGEWSEEMEAVTLDGTPDKPTDMHIECPKQDGRNYMNLMWGPPAKPNAEIKGYMMEVTGNMTYINRFGIEATDTWGPLSKFMTNNSRNVRVDDLKPNTNYTVRLSAMTRTRRRGLEEIAFCKTKPAPPDNPPRPKFIKHGEKVDDTIKYSLRVLVPRSSERNGPICCYRVYVVRLLPGLGWSKLPPPADLKTLNYHKAHGANAEIGAYVTDVFNNENFPKEELILGDEITVTLKPAERNTSCARCFVQRQLREPPRPTTPAPAPDEDTTADDDLLPEGGRDERSVDDDKFANDEMLKTKKSVVRDEPLPLEVIDGKLDPQANYTLFVELIPGTDDEPLFSGYTVALNTAIPQNALDTNTMELALKIACCVAALLLLVTLVLCVVHTRRARKMPPAHAHVELNPIQAALRYVVGHIGGRQQLVPATPPDMPPIAIENLAAAYVARQADSDYEFQKEFELLQMLPECYPDRTCHASEARENQPKNRYPDIKAYDQTRVKLSQVDGITGSDYINANFVMGYKEHKKFICAQGPTEATVNDFWRMIWEHGLELIVMLTNLEEYSKVKCSKYWPDELRGARAFGAITVHHVAEKRYSDYIVRELKITKQPTNSEGQPIVENNGVAKRNGDCKDAESASAPTSPRENKDSTTRVVRQYHFLMWKDFAAPEHPQSILRFIKRVNEAWSGLLGRPAVVHCSAGVGRTGTLVALDCLLDQLRAERRAAVFATIAELRRQRNFLVQSLKQYVFVYRALVEYAHYGDTEIPASRLKASIDRLRNTPEGADKCLMEHEFEKILNPPVPEPVKSCAAAAVEEARARNRSQDCLPYDRNRVILTPAPPAHYCTYINASFIEAYDNSEGYIITQDPLPNTIMDFWRMVSEHNVSTIVMLSELGEGKCPRYWDDGTAQYEHISVQYEESESCPYYTRRQFRVTNNKSGDVMSVRQLQYHGWPTAPGHVPEVTRGLAELADAARQAVAPHPGSAMTLHCQFGTERSALFATLCVLIAQLRTERRVDVCAAARKVRSQRAHTIDTSLQYEFLHRAILNYAELHNLLEDS